MSQPLSLAVLGCWHVHALDYARNAAEHPDTEVVAVWDTDPERGAAAAAQLGVDFVADLDVLLARGDLDAVTVTTATNEHTDVIGRAIRAGKHVFTEKLLAPTVEECESLLRAAQETGIALVVSLPRLDEPVTRAITGLIDSGALGQVTYARVRMAHDGWLGGWLPERFGDPVAAIGGALADLGCHPVYLLQRILGADPDTVEAVYGRVTDHPVEDNAVVTLGYRDGAIGVAEASFVTVPGAFAIEVRGTRGSVLHGFGRDGLLGKGAAFDDEQWVEVPLAEPHPGPFARWVAAIRDGRTDDPTQAAAVALTRVVAAANAAASKGTAS